MRTVRDADGDRYILLKESAESSRVRDPGPARSATSRTRNSNRSTASRPWRQLRTPFPRLPGAWSLPSRTGGRSGLLVEIDGRGPLDVHVLLDAYDLCESDLHGLLAEFRAAGLVEETDVAGRRGYRITDDGHDALARLRE